jgi:small-conductance mechanosensitive channel
MILGIAVALILSAGGSALAQVPAAPGTSPSEAQSPIPLVEIAVRAEEVVILLAQIDEASAPIGEIQAFEANLTAQAARLKASREDTGRRLGADPPLAVVDRLAASWQVSCAEVRGSAETVTRRAARLQQDVDRLAGLREAWTRSRSDAASANAPAVVLGRIDEIRTAISGTKARLEARLAALLVVQHRLSQELAHCDQTVARIAQTRRDLFERMGTRTGLPVWSGGLWTGAAAELPATWPVGAETLDAIAERVVRGQAGRVPLYVACFLVLLAILYRVRALVRRGGQAADGATLGAVFGRPISAAIVLAGLAGVFIFYQELWPFLYLAGLVGVVPVLRLMRPLVGPAAAAGLYAFGGLFAFDQLRFLITPLPLLEHVAFLAEMLVAACLMAWLRATRRLPTLAGPEEAPRRAAATVLLAAFATAFVTGALGYTHLARLIGLGALGSCYLGLVVVVIVRALRDLVVYALRARPLRYLRVVELHREAIERRALGLLRWAGGIGWVVGSLGAFTILDQVAGIVQRGLALPLGWGKVKVSAGEVLAFGVSVWAAVMLARLTRFVLQEEVFPRVRMGKGLPVALSSVVQFVIVLLGLTLALAALGLDFTRLTILLGALGVGVGLGLQDVVRNVAAGLILLLERSVRVGDVVRIGDLEGEVQAMRARSSTIRTWAGAEAIVPNADLISEKVTNLTLSDRRIRVEIPVGVPHETATDRVSRLLLDVARAHPNVLAVPAPTVLFQSLGDSGLQLELRCWAEDLDVFLIVRSEVTAGVHRALAEAGIPIAPPQRAVRVTMEEPSPPSRDR